MAAAVPPCVPVGSVAAITALFGLTACDSPRKASSTETRAVSTQESAPREDSPEPTARDGAASQFVSDAATYARQRLGFRDPRLSYLLVGCSDARGHLDRLSTACPGSVVATFEDEPPRANEVAFVSIGKTGIVGRRRSRGDVISLAPARCTLERFIATANMSGAQWSAASDVFIGYGPTAGGKSALAATWTVERGKTVLFSMTDGSCAPP